MSKLETDLTYSPKSHRDLKEIPGYDRGLIGQVIGDELALMSERLREKGLDPQKISAAYLEVLGTLYKRL